MTSRPLLPIILCACGTAAPGQFPDPGTATLAGRVLTEAGAPIAGAAVAAAGAGARSGAAGEWSLTVPEGAQLVRAFASGYHARAVAAERSVDIVLYPDDMLEVVVAGALLLGPRFLDPNGDGDTSVAVLAPGGGAAFAARFAAAAGLTADADAFVASLDAVLGEGPAHPTRPVLLLAPSDGAAALPALGVVVSLATSHLYDGLDPGVAATLAAVRATGVTPLGAGANDAEAYRTVVVERRGLRLGLAAFSGDTGRAGVLPIPTPPFADAAAAKAGVAGVGGAAIDRGVADVRGRADRVVVLLHGGGARDAAPANDIINAARRAVDAGADLVVASGPVAFQGMERCQGKLIVYSLGALASDDNAGEASSAALLRAFFPASGPPTVLLEPILLSGSVPAPAAGPIARDVLARAGERAAPFGVTVLADGRVVDGDPAARDRDEHVAAAVTVDGAFADLALSPGEYLVAATIVVPAGGTLWLGRELLPGGDIEDHLADGAFGPPAGWSLPSSAERVARGDDGLAVEVCRSGTSRTTAAATSAGRFVVPRGASYTLCGCWRGDAGTTAAVKLAFYDDLDPETGPIGAVAAAAGEPPATRECVCRAATPPSGALHVAVRLEHTPTADGNACVGFDDVSLVEWLPATGPSATLAAPNRVARLRATGVGGAGTASFAATVRTLDAGGPPAAARGAVGGISAPVARAPTAARRALACPADVARSVTYRADGAARTLQARVACVVASDPLDPLGDAPYFTLAASGGGALAIVARGFTGPGTYPVTTHLQGSAVAVEGGDLTACAAPTTPAPTSPPRAPASCASTRTPSLRATARPARPRACRGARRAARSRATACRTRNRGGSSPSPTAPSIARRPTGPRSSSSPRFPTLSLFPCADGPMVGR